MNQGRNRRRQKNENKRPNKVIRCKALNRPVFENEVCDKFSSKVKSNTNKTCENCLHSF